VKLETAEAIYNAFMAVENCIKLLNASQVLSSKEVEHLCNRGDELQKALRHEGKLSK
jgi:hypothetical protein